MTEANCKFEVWNRRKYPLVIREIQVTFGSARVTRQEHPGIRADEENDEWFATTEGHLLSTRSIALEPAAHVEFKPAGVVESGADPFFGDRKPVEVWVDFFDPRKNNHFVVRATSTETKWWRRSPKRHMPPFSGLGAVRRM